MRVEKLNSKKEISPQGYTREELDSELDFFLSQKLIEELFLLGEISLEEYRKIRNENMKAFAPFLAPLYQ
ncbi:SHOCT domain-containing protein [Allofustis seminis]|uniref:SHOCT domain-containing protein n=1 Tax=Allofustis seminis TaxID=166939 RepID=UPI00035FB1E1|nr:SHOCT domain-containing protein [Allofustis seminis]